MPDGLTLVRVPTYRRPDLLHRALSSLQAQTNPNWRCLVYDDSPDDNGRAVCEALGDKRITHVFNAPRKFAAQNIDQCFARSNEADYFFVLEDDNFVLPSFIEDNIAALNQNNVSIVLRNQYIAPLDATANDIEGRPTILGPRFHERVYQLDEFVCSAMFSIGVSNGGLFWRKSARTDFEVRAPDCSAVLQEHLRTVLVREPVFVALKPLAVWSDNGAETTRHSGRAVRYFQRETSLKQALNLMRRRIADALRARGRYDLVHSDLYLTSLQERQKEIAKALLPWPSANRLSLRDQIELPLRGLALQVLGRPPKDLQPLLDRLDIQGSSTIL